MSEPHGHDGHSHSTEELPYFPAAEWDQFKQDDIAAGRTIIVLVSSIFTLGLFIYTIVALSVASS